MVMAGGAEPVYGHGRNPIRQTGPLRHQPGNVVVLHTLGHGAANHYIVNILRLQLRNALEHPCQGLTAELNGMNLGQPALKRLAVRTAPIRHQINRSDIHIIVSFRIDSWLRKKTCLR